MLALNFWSSYLYLLSSTGITVLDQHTWFLSQGFYSCTKHHDQEASWGGKGLFSLHFRTGTQAGQEAGADAEAMEGCSLLACLPGLLSLLSYRTQDYQPRDGPTHKGTSPLISN